MTHIPVLLHEVISILDPKEGEFFIDGTVDGGGHAREILEKISPGGTFLAIDWDEAMIKKFRENLGKTSSWVIALRGNYADLPQILARRRLPKADGLLLDLGFSSDQLLHSERGFSFNPASYGEPLLMTYDDSRKPAYVVLRELTESQLAEIIYRFGEERFAKKIARAIKTYCRKRTLKTSGELAEVVKQSLPRNYERGRIHPATRTFQALRIYVNDELGNLEKLLRAIPGIVASHGRIGIISFHSLEDRLVKSYFRKYEKDGLLKILTKKPVTPSQIEKADNPRSRSAKFRAAIIN